MQHMSIEQLRNEIRSAQNQVTRLNERVRDLQREVHRRELEERNQRERDAANLFRDDLRTNGSTLLWPHGANTDATATRVRVKMLTSSNYHVQYEPYEFYGSIGPDHPIAVTGQIIGLPPCVPTYIRQQIDPLLPVAPRISIYNGFRDGIPNHLDFGAVPNLFAEGQDVYLQYYVKDR